MDERLYKAALEGSVESLLSLIQEDALILDRNNVTNTFLETPLHIAAMLGHEKFAIQVLRLRPDLARERDSQGSSPLHLASAKGNLAIVKACLQVSDPLLCILRNRDGKNPVHLAAMKGRVNVLEELFRVKPDAGRAIVERTNQSILHLCVECGQFETLEFLLRSGQFEDMVNFKDKNGNTILHLAVADKQTEITDFLLNISTIDVDAMNHKGMTPMDILLQRGRDIRDSEIEESLVRSRAKITGENNSKHGTASRPTDQHNSSLIQRKYKPIKPKDDDWIEKKKGSLMVVASLIATMAFQIGVAPPREIENHVNHLEDYSLLTRSLKDYKGFYIVNTISFVTSLSIILLLMSGLPLKNSVTMWFLMVITWVTIVTLALSYIYSVLLSAPGGIEGSIVEVTAWAILVWIGILILILIGHTLRLAWYICIRLIRLVPEMINSMMKLFAAKRRASTNTGYV